MQYQIDIGNANPIQSKLYRLSPEKRAFMRDAVKKMIDKAVVEHSVSPQSSPIYLVETKDGDYRFCTDYRRLDAITKKDSYPLPRIDNLPEKLREAKFFPTFSLASSYWQVLIYPPNKEKTAFITRCGFYQYAAVHSGLRNAPASSSDPHNRCWANILCSSTK